MRQITTYLVILLLMVVTVGHAASYSGSFEPEGWAWLGWAYAIAVDLAIAVCAYYTRWATTRRWASIGYISFVVASGMLNVAHLRPWTHDLGAWVYALFPTGAQALLGFLARDAGRLTKKREAGEIETKLRAQLRMLRKEHTEQSAALHSDIDRLAQAHTMKRAKRPDFENLCAGLNGDRPGDVRAVNDLLNERGFYAVPDSTARSWI